MDVCLSESNLHRYHAGEIDAAEAQRVRRHLAECAACARRDAEIVAAHEARIRQLRQL
ncbi:MAG: zf-HC2 domain-containing protein, partial [Phycisphaerae bacterium]